MKYVDMHCDTIVRAMESNQGLYKNNLHVDIEKMLKGECLLQNFAIFTDIGKHNSDFTKSAIAFYHSQMELNSKYIRPVLKYSDILDNEKQGYISALLTLEDGGVVDNDLNNLDYFYNEGVRVICLTWNYPNGIGYPNFTWTENEYEDLLYHSNTTDGLTDFGIEYVKKCEDLGIVVDVSHLSDKGFYDVLENTTKPFVASHSNARKVCPVVRNLDDDMIVALANRGGVIGINYNNDFILDRDTKPTKIENIVKHIRYITNVGGIECLGLGSDFDGSNALDFKDCSNMQLLYLELKKYYNEDEIEKIFYKNVLRVYETCLK